VSIDQHTYESWFLLYADGELSPDEQVQVDHFLLLHPELQDEFDQLMHVRLDATEHIHFDEKELLKPSVMEELEHKYRIHPDYSIRFPNKHVLYKKTAIKPIPLYRITAVAAVLMGAFLFSRMYWINEIPVRSLPVVKEERIASTSFSEVNKKDIRVTNRKPTAAAEVVVSVSEVPPEVSDVAEPSSVSEEVEGVVTPSVMPSNLSEEVRQAAEQRIAQSPIAVSAVHYEEPNTEALLRSVMEEKNHSPARGLIRKIGRTLFGERSQEEDRRYIQVASFKFPIKE